MVWRRVLEIYEQLRAGAIRFEDAIDLGPRDEEAAARRIRAEANRRFTRLASLYQDLLKLESKIASLPERHTRAKARLRREVIRLKIRCSQQVRLIPFTSARWLEFRAIPENAIEQIARVERKLQQSGDNANLARQLRREIRELEKAAAATAA